MEKYRVTITETLATSVVVEANDYNEAVDSVIDRYNNEEIVLTAEDYCETKFSVKPLEEGEIDG